MAYLNCSKDFLEFVFRVKKTKIKLPQKNSEIFVNPGLFVRVNTVTIFWKYSITNDKN